LKEGGRIVISDLATDMQENTTWLFDAGTVQTAVHLVTPNELVV